MKYKPPSVYETAFNCPHCDAYAQQTWWGAGLFSHGSSSDNSKPLIVTDENISEYLSKYPDHKDHCEKLKEGSPFLTPFGGSVVLKIDNLHVANCARCKKISIWLHDRLIYPLRGQAPPPNLDLPDDIRKDYNEASLILDHSPRGAAALLRLAVDKLCKQLGDPDKSINDNVGALVKKGLDPKLQQAFDALRVFGNNAVHPIEIDLRDDRETVESLFMLINMIAEDMISKPKHAKELFAKLPEEARKAIAKRDGSQK